jgi:Flp pilus assembly protein TadG
MTAIISRVRKAASRLSRHTGLDRFGRDTRGTTLIEFSLVALPFVALIFAILETALMFFASQVLDTAVGQTARLIRTGQAQQQKLDIDKFKADVCNQIMLLFACDTDLKITVKKFSTFGAIELDTPVDEDGNLKVDEEYDAGHGGDIVVVRAYYEWPTFVRVLGNDLADMPNGKHLLISTVAFRNEPFPW